MLKCESQMTAFKSPGRLGEPEMSLETDPRTHPKLLEAMKMLNILNPSHFAPDLMPDAPLEDLKRFVSQDEELIESLFESIGYDLPIINSPVQISRSERVIDGQDGNKIKFIIRRPLASMNDFIPAIIYFHGGAMVMLHTENPVHVHWAESLVKTDHLAVISVDFRNTVSQDGFHPYPAGLNDCTAAVRWICAHRQELNLTKMVLQGESGGANFALSTALKAKKEGWIQEIAGVCANVPFISGAYDLAEDWKLSKLPSLIECEGYLISCKTSALMAKVYDPLGRSARDPLAWPFWAAEEDMKGLPPHLIFTNEVDPLRDEGVEYHRMLLRAGVRSVGKTNLGIVHAGELILPQAVPDVFLANVWEIRKFIDGL